MSIYHFTIALTLAYPGFDNTTDYPLGITAAKEFPSVCNRWREDHKSLLIFRFESLITYANAC